MLSFWNLQVLLCLAALLAKSYLWRATTWCKQHSPLCLAAVAVVAGVLMHRFAQNYYAICLQALYKKRPFCQSATEGTTLDAFDFAAGTIFYMSDWAGFAARLVLAPVVGTWLSCACSSCRSHAWSKTFNVSAMILALGLRYTVTLAPRLWVGIIVFVGAACGLYGAGRCLRRCGVRSIVVVLLLMLGGVWGWLSWQSGAMHFVVARFVLTQLHPDDPSIVANWYREAAQRGLAEAQSALGYMHLMGSGVPRDELQAVVWYTMAAKQGHVVAMNNLGGLHREGRGLVDRDDEEALSWFTMAAETGDPIGQNNLGKMYEAGYGMGAKDEAQAVRYYQLAAEQGLANAQFNLGWLHKEGLGGLEQNDAAAVQLFARAAELGDKEAQYLFGWMLSHGMGVDAADDQRAKEWFAKAARQGHTAAEKALAGKQVKYIRTV